MDSPTMINFILGLNADQVSQVVRDFLSEHPDMTKNVYDIAMKVASDVDIDDIMDDVFFELDRIDFDDLNDRSGNTRYGYVDPSEAEFSLFEEALDPFIDEMEKLQQRSLPAAAKSTCIGIIKGLLKYKKESKSDFSGWAGDTSNAFVDIVVKKWKKGKPNKDDIAEVMIVAKGA